MAFLNETFNVNELPQSTGGNFDPIPAGWYQVEIKGAELKNTKDGTGSYIAIRYDVTGADYNGRVIWGNLNIRNKSEKAEEIGRQQLGELMRATGLAKVSDTDQLIGNALMVKVAIRESEQYGAQNEVKGFKAIAGSQAPMPSAAPAAKAKPAWAKK